MKKTKLSIPSYKQFLRMNALPLPYKIRVITKRQQLYNCCFLDICISSMTFSRGRNSRDASLQH